MTFKDPFVDISGDATEILCSKEEATSWLYSLKEEYEESIGGLTSCSLNLAFLTISQMQDINKKFAGNDKPTNVLSFPSNGELSEDGLIGDVAICSELIIEEARTQGKSTQNHLIHIFVHGILHLLGHDHEESSSAEKMESLEVRILEKIGVADPY